ncbi:MAG: PKD domain-containing protein [Saprospiraceae bacterium]|nr:PKD domain-containing protein [Saprospiraceae bacterium]
MNKLISSFILIFFTFGLQAQDIVLKATKRVTDPALYQKFAKIEQYEINIEDFRKRLEDIQKVGIEMELQLEGKSFTFQLFEYTMYNENTRVRIQTENGLVERRPSKELRTFRGSEAGFSGGPVALTVSKDFLSITHYDKSVGFFLEQYHGNDPTSTSNTFIYYAERDILPFKGIECGFDKLSRFKSDPGAFGKSSDHDDGSLGIDERNKKCYIIDVALACEIQFTNFHRGPFGAEAFMLNILNNMAILFLDPSLIIAEYQIALSDMWISEDSLRDFWNGSNDIFNDLAIFTFRQSGMFTNGFDVATLWTTKYTSGVVGLANLATACRQNGTNVCSQFISGVAPLRQLQAHEIGHNLSCTHDPPGNPTIMAPVVNGSSIWSSFSAFEIISFTNTQGTCFDDCTGGNIPVPEFEADITYGCVPVVVRYTNLSINANSYKWSFPGGNPATSTAVNPVVTYSVPDRKFDVSLEAINPLCSVALTKKEYIETNDFPIVNWEGGNTQQEGDRLVWFQNYSLRGETYEWTFGDGNTSEEFQPEHEYAKDSTYRVCLKVTNDCGTRELCKNVQVYTYPSIDFEADTTWGCAPKTIKFFDLSSSNVIAWNWEFPGGTPSVSQAKNPVIKYSNPGTYKVKLTVNTRKFFTNKTREMYIVIDSLPATGFDYQINGSTVTFTNKTRYGKTYEWDFGDSKTSLEENPSHSYTAAGRYEVKFWATNDCGRTLNKQFINIGEKPAAGFRTADPVGCAPYTVQFENTSTASATDFEWSFPGGNPSSSTERNPIVTFPTKGKYDVKLVAKNFLESDSITVSEYIEVKQAPTASFQNSIAGFNVFFNNTSQESGNYFWDFGDNKSSTEQNPTHNYGVEGEFNVKLIVENECGIDTFEKLIAVYLIPKVNFASDTIKGCAPLNVRFIDKSSIDVIEWNWQFEEGSPMVSFDKNPTVRFNKAGRYTVKLTVKNTNGTNAETKLRYIEVISPIFCPKKPDKKGPKSIGETELVEYDMYSRSVTPVIETKVFPNPANHMIYLQTISGAKFQMVNITGQMVLSGTTQLAVQPIDVIGLEPGTYMLRVEHPTTTKILKVLITK